VKKRYRFIITYKQLSWTPKHTRVIEGVTLLDATEKLIKELKALPPQKFGTKVGDVVESFSMIAEAMREDVKQTA
jgi:hypothetical protein